MKIVHNPIFDTEKVIKHYSEKDGVDIKYVCTSALSNEYFACDIFYRDTPHPEFGNKYFGIYDHHIYSIMICNADKIEDTTFFMVEGSDVWEYSAHRHDFHKVEGVDVCIDGGRAYNRMVGKFDGISTGNFQIKNGEFIRVMQP